MSASVDGADDRRDVLVVAASAAHLDAQEDLLRTLREVSGVVLNTSFVAALPWLAGRRGAGVPDGAPRPLAPWRTRSSWRRAVTLAAAPLPGAHRRARWATRLDPWFRQTVRPATDLVVLGPSGDTVVGVAGELGADPRVHRGTDGLRALVHDLVGRELTGAVEAVLDGSPAPRLPDDVLRRIAAAARGAAVLPAADRARWRAQLLQLPRQTREPGQVRALASLARVLLAEDDPALAAYLVRADLDEHAATRADPARVAARLLEAADPLLDVDLPGAVELAALALEVLFHRELHSDSVGTPLVTDPDTYLAPVRTTRTWQLLTRAVDPPPVPEDPGSGTVEATRPPTLCRVLLLPGSYGTFLDPVAAALRVSPAVDVAVVRRGELRPHLRTMGVSAAVLHRRLAASLGQPFTGYPELTSLLGERAPDVVLLDWADKTAVLATLLAPAHARVVLRVHGVDALRPWVHLLDWSRVEAVVCVSPAMRDLVRDVVGERARAVPVHVIPNLVELPGPGASAPAPREPRTLCMVGWAQRVKDPLWALEVLAELRRDGDDWRLLLLGADFPEEGTASGEAYARAFRERAMADDVRDHVEYTGFLEPGRLVPVLARAGFVLSASLRESFHVGLVEGVLAGAVPVVRDWPMLASRGGARSLYGDAVVADVAGAVERIRSLASPQARDRAAREARETLVRTAEPVVATTQLREVILGEVGHLADLSATGRHEDALEVVRAVLDDRTRQAPAALLHQAAVSAALAGEQTLRLQVLRRWAEVDPSEQVHQLVSQQDGRLRELTPGWLPPVDVPGEPLGPRPPGGSDRVLHLLKASLPYRRSGYTLRSAYLLTEQARSGTDLLAVTALDFPPTGKDADGSAPVPAEEQVGGVRHLRLRRDRVPVPENPDDYLTACATALTEVVRRERPTVIHAHSGHRGYDLALVALAAGRATGVPVVYEVRGFFEALWTSDLDRSERSEMYRLRRAVETACMQQAAAVTTLSESMRQDILEREGIDPRKVFVVPNGVDPGSLTPRTRRPDLVTQLGVEGSFTFGYVSNLDHPREGQELLVEAVLRLREGGLDATALVVGSGAREAELRDLARRRGVAEHVILTGGVDHDRVGDYYALLDVFVVPRVDERAARLVTPLKPYEAMAMRLPVVVSGLPALLEIVGEGERGESFPAGDAGALAAVLARLAADPGHRDRLAEAGRRWVLEHRTWAAAAARYQQVYDVAAATAQQSGAVLRL